MPGRLSVGQSSQFDWALWTCVARNSSRWDWFPAHFWKFSPSNSNGCRFQKNTINLSAANFPSTRLEIAARLRNARGREPRKNCSSSELPAHRSYGIFTIMAMDEGAHRPIRWLGSSLNDLRKFPKEVAREIGYALWFAQAGDKHPSAKPLKGYRGARVLEVVEDHAGNTYRAVYTVRFARAIYVLHVFQKKSKSGIKTAAHEIELVKSRLKWAKSDYEQWLKEDGG